MEDVDLSCGKKSPNITEKEIELREQSEEKAKAEVAKKQREANLKKTEAAKDTKIKVPELSGTAQKRKEKGCWACCLLRKTNYRSSCKIPAPSQQGYF